MKQRLTIFLQCVVVLTGIVSLAIMIRFPLSEGRATNLDLFTVYSDPFILYCYATSIPYFIALFNAFRLLGSIRQNKEFSLQGVKTLRNIRYSAIVLGILIVLAGVYIILFHHKDDDPAGFLAICFVTTFICAVVATAVKVFEGKLQKGMETQSENNPK